MEQKSKKSLRSFFTILISLVFAAFFLWLALKDFDFTSFKTSIQKANYWWVAAAGFFAVLAYWLRAVRWNMLLEPLGYSISSKNSLWAISFGYLLNLTIPRSGEVARATALYRAENIPVDKSFGTIILERVIDLVCMLGFLLLTVIFKFDVIVSFYRFVTEKKEVTKAEQLPNDFENFLLKIGIKDFALFYLSAKIFAAVLVLSFIFFLIKYRKKQLVTFGKGIWEGITSILKLKQKGKFVFYTVAIWVSYYLASYLVCFALTETSGFTVADGFFIIVVGTLGMIVPASGGIGAFNLAMKYGFMTLFIAAGQDGDIGGKLGLTYSFISLPLQIFITLVMGILSMIMLAKSGSHDSSDS